MFVASRVEFGDECRAAAAVLPHVIGNIETATGCGTIRRANGVAVQVMVGDPVCQDDVIETSADGQIGIRFIDGTVFNLSRGTRVVLTEFVCDSDGNPQSALFEVTRGTFAFFAGQLAKTGSLRVDTPVGSIRGRTAAGGFGMLSLTALTFTIMSDVQAADPNATFLDEDSIRYKDLEHGVFELVTKELIPRHLFVWDPGETIELSRRGSSISVNQVANSAARMDELHAAQQDVLANFAKGLVPKGSSSPDFFNPQSPQPISFTQIGAVPAQNSLAPLPTVDITIPDIIIVHLPPPPPTLNAAPGPIEIDTVVFDNFTASSGTFTASSPRSGATLTFGISGGTAGNTVLGGVTYDLSKVGSLGTLYLNSATGAYTFVPNSDAINALKSDTTQNFIITVSDGTLSASETFTINIHGVDDAAIISGTATGAVIEVRGVINATQGTQTTTGTLTDTDPDDPANTFTAVSSPTKSAGGYGTFTMTTAGTWTYTLDDTNSAVQALNVGGTLTDSFTVTSIDGTPKVVTITIHGPLVGATGTVPSLTLSETHLTATALDGNIAGSAPDATLTTTSGDFSTAFTSVQGVGGATISYALSITGGNGTASGLIDSHTGQADVLVLNGSTIEGHVGTTGGVLAFTITVDPTTGRVTFTEYRPVTQPLGTNPDGGEGASLTAGVVNLTATVTDTDGNFQTASIELGSRLTLIDDGPTIAATGTAPSLTLSETHLTATPQDDNIAGTAPDATLTTTSGNFSTAFTSVQGADGATISYALSISGGNGTASGLIDSHTGQADVLVLNGNTIEGHVGTTSGTLAFTITLDPATGRVTFTEYRAMTQTSNPNGGEGASLTAGIVNLTATITDKDGDFQTASLDLGSRLTITDDGPGIGGFSLATILAQQDQVANGTYNVSFGADGDSAMRVAVHNGAVNGFNLATADLGGGITSVHVTGNGDDYTFYYTTEAVSGGVKLDAFFTDTGGTLSDPFFTLLIKPDGTYTFDIEGVGFLQQTTVSGSDFGASSSGQPFLTSPDGLLVITGDFNGAPADVKASNNGIAVGDSGLQMDQQETLVLTFTPQQTDVSFDLTQWQGNGTADVVFTVHDGATDIHDFSINVPKPSGDAHIVVEKTSNPALINTFTFNSATSTYTLYVGSEFNQIGVSYDHAATGNATFTVDNITYAAGTKIPSTDLLFDVTAVDGDGDTSTTSLQVDLLGSTNVTSALALSATPQLATTTINATNDVVSGTMAASALAAGSDPAGTPTAAGIADTSANNPPNSFAAVSSPTAGDGGYGAFTMTAAGVWTYTLDNTSSVAAAPTGHDSLAVGGNGGQIIHGGAGNDTLNGTGKADIIHAGSGNDTIKGNDVADTVHGGSGDTFKGDNGNDAVIGGYGADNRTGSNGNDRFVNPSAAEAGRSITDFRSGSNKLDLTAFGALAFMELTSTQHSVPAHTIAWFFDSAANQTVVYVNPTDQALKIGDSGLLEIHLQGIATIEATDFVPEPTTAPVVVAAESIDLALAATAGGDGTVVTATTADVSSDSTVSDGAHISDWSWTADDGFRFHFAPDRIDSTGHARFAGFGEAPTNSTADSDGDAVITLASTQSIEPHNGHAAAPMEDHFTFDQKPVHGNAGAMAIGDGAVIHQGGTINHTDIAAPNAAAELRLAEHGAAPEGGNGNGRSQGNSNDVSGVASVDTPGNKGHSESIPKNADLGNAAGTDVDRSQAAGPPGLGDSFHFKDEVVGSKHSDIVSLADVGHTQGSIDHPGNAAGPQGPPVISETQTVELSLPGPHPADHSNNIPDHAASAVVAHNPHDLIV